MELQTSDHHRCFNRLWGTSSVCLSHVVRYVFPCQWISTTDAMYLIAEGRSKVLPITVGTIVILGSGVAISMVWAVYKCRVFTDFIKIEWTTYMTLGTMTFVDVIIASSLCHLLATSRTGFSSSDYKITKLMAYIVNTGCLTSICSMVAVIICAAMPHDLIFLGVEFLLAKLYVNSFFALLNARSFLQPTTDTNNNSSEVHMRHALYRPELNVKASQDEESQGSQGSRKNMFKHSDDEVMHITSSAMVSSCVSGGGRVLIVTP
ncbi:hypothetical protein DEU56DRAFT_880665 [Suillus clintonianus]|uniref:uncharacterized protein n=1 Tax=Suillus clintonianus TaxID=1904413 RepID=UPI001B877FC7|nr:uncharacterized protein DEU56DRAFT_880665 [Suillus clintonianus]KAG2150392.1 hypothetical protein DEU56DRAFT_880665 [Suillus clintonianus]